MVKNIKNFGEYLNEYWISSSPGSVVVPGEWYKDSVNSKNYKPVNTTLPDVINPMFEEDEVTGILSSMKNDQNLVGKIKNSADPIEIIDIIGEYILSKRKD